MAFVFGHVLLIPIMTLSFVSQAVGKHRGSFSGQIATGYLSKQTVQNLDVYTGVQAEFVELILSKADSKSQTAFNAAMTSKEAQAAFALDASYLEKGPGPTDASVASNFFAVCACLGLSGRVKEFGLWLFLRMVWCFDTPGSHKLSGTPALRLGVTRVGALCHEPACSSRYAQR